MKKIIFIILLSSCSSIPHYKNRISGIIGCPSEEIDMGKEPTLYMSGLKTFEIKCRGKKFYCSADSQMMVNGFGQISQSSETVNCKEELK